MKLRKPKKWEWAYGVIWIVLGIFRTPIMNAAVRLPLFLAFLLDFITGHPNLGAGWCIGLLIVRAVYAGLSPEEKREADRRDTDERNVAICGKASYLCLNVTWVFLLVFMLLLDYWGSKEEALWCGVLTLASIFGLPLFQYWYGKRM